MKGVSIWWRFVQTSFMGAPAAADGKEDTFDHPLMTHARDDLEKNKVTTIPEKPTAVGLAPW